MVHRASKFTPQVLLSAPRRSAGVPNADASLILYTTSTYSFETHAKTSSLCVLKRGHDSIQHFAGSKSFFGLAQGPPTTGGETRRLASAEGISGLNWLDDDDLFAFLHAGKNGETQVVIASIKGLTTSGEMNLSTTSEGKGYYVAGSIHAPAGNLKIKSLSKESGYDFAVVVSAQASLDGSLYNSETAKATRSTGRLYSTTFVRHWDRYETKERDTLWYARLHRSSSGDRFKLSSFTNALPRLGLECPISTFGGTDNFDISSSGIIFVAKDPNVSPALNTKCNAYLLKITDWSGGDTQQPLLVPTPGYEGAATCPVFSEDGKQAAFLKMKTNGYESDRNVIFGCGVEDDTELVVTAIAANSWHLSPTSVCFSTLNTDVLYITAERAGTGRLLVIDRGLGQEPPVDITGSGNVSEIVPLPHGSIFLTGSTLVDSSLYVLLTRYADGSSLSPKWGHSISDSGSKYGLSHNQVDGIWTPASNPHINPEVHSVIVRPSHFDRNRKYPVAYLIHGGPQGAWLDSWSTRWNPAVFAEQGYIVVAPNPTGSTGYGQHFTDAIRCNWGGDPYQDIVNVFDWVGKNMPEADNDRAVALGGSYGGYMVNWYTSCITHLHTLRENADLFPPPQQDPRPPPRPEIQSPRLPRRHHQLRRRPILDRRALLPLPRPRRRALGQPTMLPHPSRQPLHPLQHPRRLAIPHRHFFHLALEKMGPGRLFHEWQTPQLVIHSAKDYRLPISEGLAAYNVLQARGVESQFLMFPDENHWVLQPENSLVWHKTALNFVNKYVGKEPFTTEDPESDPEYFGGVKEEAKAAQEEAGKMPTLGQVMI
jgi:dipeptidyl aminopeptidase/acylaminoacyl peptidase